MRSFTFLVAAFAALVAAVPKPHHSAPASSGIVVLTDIVYLNSEPAKVTRSTELVNDYIKKVYDNEPNTLEYEVHIEEAEAKIVIYAVYKDHDAFQHHLETSYLAELQSVFDHEGLEREGDKIHFLTPIAGFEREGA